jgi:hypothetical protein
VHSSHHIALASHRHHSQLTSKLFAEHAHYIAVTRRLYTSSCETEDARRRVHHFTRRHGSLRDVATFSPYNTSHIATYARVADDLQMTSLKPDQMSRTPQPQLPLDAPSSHGIVPQSETLICKLRQESQCLFSIKPCVNSRETGKLRTSRLLTPVDYSDENVRSSASSTAVSYQ